MKVYNKLVRDNIPQIIEQSGKTCKTRVLSDDEYVENLNAKLSEEFAEYLQSGEVEELADIVEVALALAHAKGVTRDKFDAIRTEKFNKNGAFDKKLFLEWVDDGD
ncbi:MAG: nucleoside triphosphate pyrophosphohydrolase [Clostridiales bacterium]|nr:nucleoside triphosphate pyrophosphohydrolase [Clostridiales bacterium]